MTGITDKEYFQALFAEKERATGLAAEEREKAASALREAMARSISEGDERLREHISNQIAQINAALLSADKLELARISAVQNQLTLALDAAQTAVLKAEAADSERFASHNGLIEQMRRQAVNEEGKRQSMVANLMPREVVEAQLQELRQVSEARYADILKTIHENREQINTLRDKTAGSKEQQTEQREMSHLSLAGAMAVIAVLNILAVVGVAAAIH